MIITSIKQVASLKPAADTNLTGAHDQAMHRSLWLAGTVESLLKRLRHQA